MSCRGLYCFSQNAIQERDLYMILFLPNDICTGISGRIAAKLGGS